MAELVHLATAAAVADARRSGLLRAPSLESEGFVHRCLERHFPDRSGLLRVTIDPDRLSAQLVHEDRHGIGERFPQDHGPIEMTAVVSIVPLDTASAPQT